MLYDPKQNPIVKTLYDAADLIDQRGLAKMVFEDAEGHLCMNGAIAKAKFGRADFWSLTSAQIDEIEPIRAVLMKFLTKDGQKYNDPSAYNNARERTKEEVVEALRGAAEMVIVNGC